MGNGIVSISAAPSRLQSISSNRVTADAAYVGFRIEAALLTLHPPYFSAKINANFPRSGPRHGLPTLVETGGGAFFSFNA